MPHVGWYYKTVADYSVALQDRNGSLCMVVVVILDEVIDPFAVQSRSGRVTWTKSSSDMPSFFLTMMVALTTLRNPVVFGYPASKYLDTMMASVLNADQMGVHLGHL